MGIPRTGGGGWRMESGRSAIGMRVGEVCGVRKTIQKLHFLPIGNGIYLSRPLGARGVHHFFFLVSQVCSRVAYMYAFFSSRVSCLLQHSLVSISITSFRERTPTKPANVPRAWT